MPVSTETPRPLLNSDRFSLSPSIDFHHLLLLNNNGRYSCENVLCLHTRLKYRDVSIREIKKKYLCRRGRSSIYNISLKAKKVQALLRKHFLPVNNGTSAGISVRSLMSFLPM